MAKELSDKEMENKVMQDALKKFYESKKENGGTPEDGTPQVEPQMPESIQMPEMDNVDPNKLETKLSTETDPDLIMTYEIVALPSGGKFYPDGLKEVKIEYLTSRDEDLLTTPSFIEDGTVIDRLLDRKIVDKNVDPRKLLSGDRSALILFLRTSSYGNIYKVSVPDPRTGKAFEAEVDLLKLKYKEVKENPDEKGEFTVELPMRKKIVKFRLLTSGEESQILKNAEARQEAYGEEYNQYNTMRIKAAIQEIGGNRERSYIDRFVDVMPALDAFTIRRKIMDVTPDVEMSYEFKTHDGYKFEAPLSMGVDFFFPSL